MTISQSLLPEFDQEIAHTRKSLERIPEDKLDWRPHVKSWTLGGLATHIANLLSWTTMVLGQDALDIAPPGQPPLRTKPAESRAALLQIFEKNVIAARSAIAEASDALLTQPWTLLAGGKVIFTRPRIDVIRSTILSHLIHHRAQLGVCLRLLDVPVPAIYGPSADEGGM